MKKKSNSESQVSASLPAKQRKKMLSLISQGYKVVGKATIEKVNGIEFKTFLMENRETKHRFTVDYEGDVL